MLVIYNSQDATSQAVRDYYLTKRPNVLSFDLNDTTLGPGTISYPDYVQKIRDPIRSHLNNNNLEQSIQVLVLTKNLPHRIQSIDTSNLDIGDTPTAIVNLVNAGNATYASVDSELCLLQFNLNENENNGNYDSFADNAVTNPYFRSNNAFSSYSRNNITANRRTFYRENPYGWWRLYSTSGPSFQHSPVDAGHIYLTARLDADTLADVQAMIDRAQTINIRQDLDAILLDSDGNTYDRYIDPLTSASIDDYSASETAFASSWDKFQRNTNSTFLIGSTGSVLHTPTSIVSGPVAYVNSFGVNHSGGGKRNYLLTFDGQLVPGAAYASYESYGARGLGGLTNKNQAQVEDWITAGGTFAIAPVWEPLTYGISRSEIFIDRFYNQGYTFVEAAWASILQLSWQTVVIGDPLATATITNATPYELWVFGARGTTPDIDNQALVSADPDLDTIDNGLEYVLGLNPNQADNETGQLPVLIYGNEPEFTFITANPIPSDTSIIVEVSEALEEENWTTIGTRGADGNWNGTATITETLVSQGIEIEVLDTTASSVTRRFYRLSVDISQ